MSTAIWISEAGSGSNYSPRTRPSSRGRTRSSKSSSAASSCIPGSRRASRANTPDSARFTFNHVLEDLLQDKVEKNFELYKRVTDDERFGEHFKSRLYEFYRRTLKQSPAGPEKSSMVDAVVDVLVAEMSPEKIILFGSAARAEMDEESDLDLLVVLPEVADQHAEMVRAYEALGRLPNRPPVDVLVFSQKEMDAWSDVAGHVINEALLDGRVVYDGA